MENKIEIQEVPDFEDDEQQFEESSFILSVDASHSIECQYLIKDLVYQHETEGDGVRYKRISSTEWKVSYPQDHARTRKELMDGLKDVFANFKIIKYNFST